MVIETTFTPAEVGLGHAPASTRSARLRPGWILSRLALIGLLLFYLAGLVRDYHRVRRLEAEPTPPSKVITKYEAWNRLYSRPARHQ
jgi:hypothetical protein